MYIISYSPQPSAYDPDAPRSVFDCEWVPDHAYALTDCHWLVPGTDPDRPLWQETGSDDD